MQIRWSRFIAAVLVGAATCAGANAVDQGMTRPWPDWARGAWAAGLVMGVLAVVFLLATGLGFLTDDTLSEAGDPTSPHGHSVTVRLFVTVYLAFLGTAVAFAFGVAGLYGVRPERTILVYCGTVFLLASSGKPWWLYETIRRVRWFALIERDSVMRVLLAVIGAACVAVGLAGKLS